MGSGTNARRMWFDRNLASLREHLSVPLYANAYALIVNQVLTAGLGFFYWILAARLYPTEVVGRNSAILSSILFLASAAELSFKAAMTRFVPRAGNKTTRLVLYALGINLAAAFVIGLLVVTIGPYFSLTATLMESVDFWPGWLILAGMAWCVFYVQDGILTGMRQALWVAVKNTLHSVVKISLLVAFIWLASDYGIILSWFGPVPVFILAVQALILWRFMPSHVALDTTTTRPVHRQELYRSTVGDYVGTLLFEACVRVLPLLVLNQIGEESTAFYYQAWVVANPVYLIATNMASSFTVEASADMTRIGQTSRRILRQMARIILPAVMLLWLATPLILSFFGTEYAIQGTALLRWLLLTTLPLTINTWYLNYARVLGDVRSIILVQGTTSALTLLGSFMWLPTHGIASIGLAWLLAQGIVALGVLVRMAPALLSRHEPEVLDRPSGLSHALRRADWRFLAGTGQVRRAFCPSPGPLAESLRAAFPQVDERAHGNDYDLAAAVRPGRARLRELHDALAPGGTICSEWPAWRMGGARGARRRLKAAGFVDPRLYWPLPGLSDPRLWLPLPASREACAYAAGMALPGAGAARRIARGLLAIGLRFAAGTGLVPALVAVAQRPPAPEADTFSWVRAELTRLRLETNIPRLSFLVRTGGILVRSTLAMMIFQPGNPQPSWVVKVPRVPEDAPSLANERAILDELQHSSDGRLPEDALPRPVFDRQHGGTAYYVQTALTGQPLDKALSRDTLGSLAGELTDWQIALAGISRDWPRSTSCQEFAAQVCADLESMLAGQPTQLADILRSRGLLSGLDGLPMVCLHNDFSAWNILRGPQGLRVFDWTDAERSGPPLLDLVYGLSGLFLVQAHAWESEGAARVYRGLLDPGSIDGRIFQDCLFRYAHALGMPEDRIPALRLLSWMLNCRLELRIRQAELGALTARYESMYAALWKTELELQTGAEGPE